MTDTNTVSCDLSMCGVDEVCAADGTCTACTADAFEDNNSFEAVKTIPEGTTSDLQLCSGDEDWFQFTVPENNGQPSTVYIAVTFTHTNSRDITVELSDANNEVLLATGSSGSDNEIFSFFLDDDNSNQKLAAGVYNLRVFNDNPEPDANTYAITVDINPDFPICRAQNSNGDCTNGRICDAEFKCSAIPCETNGDCASSSLSCTNMECVTCTEDVFDTAAPNDTSGTATDLTGNLTTSETLNTCLGSDFYSFTVNNGQSVSAQITFDKSGGDLDAVMRSPSGQRFGSVEGAGDNGLTTRTSSTTVSRAEEAGTWTFQIFPSPAIVVNDYTLSVTITDN